MTDRIIFNSVFFIRYPSAYFSCLLKKLCNKLTNKSNIMNGCFVPIMWVLYDQIIYQGTKMANFQSGKFGISGIFANFTVCLGVSAGLNQI